ncbi:MAG: hypothetical protein Q4D14_07050, partial [Bacteroidales bacterium]|nr:hypothetical protein [Bacteroidales bacterium]
KLKFPTRNYFHHEIFRTSPQEIIFGMQKKQHYISLSATKPNTPQLKIATQQQKKEKHPYNHHDQ